MESLVNMVKAIEDRILLADAPSRDWHLYVYQSNKFVGLAEIIYSETGQGKTFYGIRVQQQCRYPSI